MPRRLPIQKIPKVETITPTLNFGVFSDTRGSGRCAVMVANGISRLPLLHLRQQKSELWQANSQAPTSWIAPGGLAGGDAHQAGTMPAARMMARALAILPT